MTTYTYKYLGSEPTCFVTVGINAFPGVPIKSHMLIHHPLLELVDDGKKVKEVEEVKDFKTSAVVPETNELPVSGDELKEN